MTRRLVVATGNVGGTAKPPLSMLTSTGAGKPDVIVLTEADDAEPGAEDWGRRHGYERDGAATDTLVLTRTGLLTGKQQIHMSEHWWWGPSRGNLRKREPRTYLEFTLDATGGMGVHLPPGGPDGGYIPAGRNKAAWHESADMLRTWLDQDGPRIVAGDLNGKGHEIERHIAAPAGAVVAMTGQVDGVVAKGWRHVTTHRIRDEDIPGHGWGVVTLRRA